MLLVRPHEKDLGDGFKVRRALPAFQKRMIGPFVFWDHMGPVDLKTGYELVVRAHPHIGLATMTYLFSGAILHRDSLGNELLIQPGEINWMIAGKGIVHSERSQPHASNRLEGIQLWVALPGHAEESDPQFQHFQKTDLPLIQNDWGTFHVIAGDLFGKSSPLNVFSPLFYASVNLNPRDSIPLPKVSGHEAGVYVLSNDVSVEGQDCQIGDLLIFGKEESVNLKVTAPAHVMYFGGEPFLEERIVWWNFVSSSKERLEQAKADWQAGRFAQVPNEAEFIPLPES